MLLVNYKDAFATELKALKRVSSDLIKDAEIKNLLQYIDYINNGVGDYTLSIDKNYDANGFKIPSEMKCLFYPSRLVIDISRDGHCKNLINKDATATCPADYDYNSFVRDVTKLYATLRKMPSFDVSIRDVRCPGDVGNYAACVMSDGKTQIAQTVNYLPIPLTVDLFEDYVYCVDVQTHMNMLFRNLFTAIIG